MKLEVKIKDTGASWSNVHKFTQCAVCGKLTDVDSEEYKELGELVHVDLLLKHPRSAKTHEARLSVHVKCLRGLADYPGGVQASTALNPKTTAARLSRAMQEGKV